MDRRPNEDIDNEDYVPEFATCEYFRDWAEFRNYVDDEFSENDWVFRGQRDFTWSLTTSLERLEPFELKLMEDVLIEEFARGAHHYLRFGELSDLNTISGLALMQHYGVPTRLLDWTRSPYVAVYFALEHMRERSSVWALDLTWLKDVCVTMLKRYIPRYKGKVEKLYDPDYLRLVFEECPPGIYPAEPRFLNDRMSAQQGVTLVPGNPHGTFAANLSEIVQLVGRDEVRRHVYKLDIDQVVRLVGYGDLERMNISRATLFPGLEGFAQSLRYKYYLK